MIEAEVRAIPRMRSSRFEISAQAVRCGCALWRGGCHIACGMHLRRRVMRPRERHQNEPMKKFRVKC